MHDVINLILNNISNSRDGNLNPLAYLEIGVHEGLTFENVNSCIENKPYIKIKKEGVDPYGKYEVSHRMTSQNFFAMNEYFWKKKYDVIFIDAFHFSPIVNQEIQESLKILNTDGVIILHDTIPRNEASGSVKAEPHVKWFKHVSYPEFNNYKPDEGFFDFSDFPGYPAVHGDVWKSVVKIRMEDSSLKVASLESHGCTLVKRGKQELVEKISPEELNWDYYINNYHKVFNPISVNDVKNFQNEKHDNLVFDVGI